MEKLPQAGESDVYVERGGVRHSKACRACDGRGTTVAGGEWRERDVECDSCHGEGSYEDAACDCRECCDLLERIEIEGEVDRIVAMAVALPRIPPDVAAKRAEVEVLRIAEQLALDVVERGATSPGRINDLILAVQRERIAASVLRRETALRPSLEVVRD